MPKYNPNICSNPVGVLVVGLVMLDPLRSRSLLAPFFTRRFSIKECSSLGVGLLSFSFLKLPDAKRDSKIVRREKMKAFIGGFLGFEYQMG